MRRSHSSILGPALLALALVACPADDVTFFVQSDGGTPDAPVAPSLDITDDATGDVPTPRTDEGMTEVSDATDVGPPPDCTSDDDCDDGDPCTVNSCDEGTCAASWTAGNCDDGDDCTTSDTCVNGKCVGDEIVCDDGNSCTKDWCFTGVCTSAPLDDPQCDLVITVTSPTRGATISGVDTVTVTGTVSSPAAAIESFSMGDASIPLDGDGGFSTTLSPDVGMNVIALAAANAMDQQDNAVQTFLYGVTLATPAGAGEGTTLPGRMGAWLGAPVFNDGLADLDDFSSLGKEILQNYDVLSALPDPLFADDEKPSFWPCEWDVTIQSISYDVEVVSLSPDFGGVDVYLYMTDLEVVADAIDQTWGCPSFAPTVLTATEATLSATMAVSVEDGVPDVSPEDVAVSIDGTAVDIVGGAGAMLDWVVDWFEDDLEARLETEMAEALPEQLMPLVAGAIDQLASFEQTLTIEGMGNGQSSVDLTLGVSLNNIQLSPEGAIVVMDTSTSTATMVDDAPAGSIMRGACGASPGEGSADSCVGHCGGVGPANCWCDVACYALGDCCADWSEICIDIAGPIGWLTAEEELEAVLHEDLANQILFRLWSAGYLHLTLTQEQLGDNLDGTSISEVEVQLSPDAPPVITTCTDDGGMEFQMGDLRLDATMLYGDAEASFTVYGSFRMDVGFGVGLDMSGAPALSLTNLTLAEVLVDVQSATGFGELGATFIELLFSDTLAELVTDSVLSGLVMSYPLPTIDLSTLVSTVPAGTVLGLEPESAGAQEGHIWVEGKVTSL